MRTSSAAQEPEFSQGTIFANFEIIGLIGSGAMAEVYRARDAHAANREVALKILSREARLSQTAALVRELFLGEAKALASVSSPHVVRIVSAGAAKVDGQEIPYLAMEYLQGRDLAAHLRAARRTGGKSRLPTTEAVDIVTAVCEGVLSCHQKNVVHRDIKTANIFLHETPTGLKPVLLDLSVAKLIRDEDAHKSITQILVGTPSYMAPEQDAGRPATVLSDQYSLAAVLFRCLAGVSPKRKNDPGAFLAYECPDLDPRLIAVLTRALSVIPQDRFPSVFEFGAALQPFASKLTQDVWRPFYGRRALPDATVVASLSAPTVVAPKPANSEPFSTVSVVTSSTTVDPNPPAFMLAVPTTELPPPPAPPAADEPGEALGRKAAVSEGVANRGMAPRARWMVAAAICGLLGVLAITVIGKTPWRHPPPAVTGPAGQPSLPETSPVPGTAFPVPAQAPPRTEPVLPVPPDGRPEARPPNIVHAIPFAPSSSGEPDPAASETRRRTPKKRRRPKLPVPGTAPSETMPELERAPDGSPILPLDFGEESPK
jgi:serine/threonine-protein kinase